MRKIALLEKQAAAFINEVNAVEKTYHQLKDKKKAYEIQTSIDTIKLCFDDQVPAPQDRF